MILSIFLCALLIFKLTVCEANEPPDILLKIDYVTVKTKNGFIQGETILYNNTPINVFKGIPFAKPPIGPLRFKKPEKVDKWKGIYHANTYKTPCPQSIVPVTHSEDCLYMNIWSPVVVSNAPVLVYVHGGGLLIGAGAYSLPDGTNIYDGLEFAKNGIVFVSMNYRLGVFGLLYSGTEEAPGNQALWDQLLALQWIQENIEAFGGNPNEVTLFGNSAGSWAISVHALSPVSSKLFNKAIMTSGSLLPKHHQMNSKDALNLSISFAQNSGKCLNETEFVECLRKIDYKTLLNQQFKHNFNVFKGNNFKLIHGVDHIFPRPMIHAFEDNSYNKNISFLLGHTELEGYIFVLYPEHFGVMTTLRYFLRNFFKIDKDVLINDIKTKFIPISNQTILDKIVHMYTNINETGRELKSLNKIQRMAAIHALGDYHFTCPTVLFGVEMAKNNHNVYQFLWNYGGMLSKITNSDYSTHGADIFTLFNSPLIKKYHLPFSRDEIIMSDFFMDILVNFVKTGKPNRDEEWPSYRLDSNGSVSASFMSLSLKDKPTKVLSVNAYKGSDGLEPSVVNNCIGFWDDIYKSEF